MPTEISIENRIFQIPESNDPCELWVGYFDSLRTALGAKNARTIWLVTWKTNGSASCTTNGSFNRWLQKNKIDVSSAATRAIADASEIGSNFMGLGKNFSKIAEVGFSLFLVLILITLGMMIWKTGKEADIKDLAMLTPVGKSVGAGFKFMNK